MNKKLTILTLSIISIITMISFVTLEAHADIDWMDSYTVSIVYDMDIYPYSSMKELAHTLEEFFNHTIAFDPVYYSNYKDFYQFKTLDQNFFSEDFIYDGYLDFSAYAPSNPSHIDFALHFGSENSSINIITNIINEKYYIPSTEYGSFDIAMKDCSLGTRNDIYYSPKDDTIYICYQWLAKEYKKYEKYSDQDERMEVFDYYVGGVVLHELGHVFIDMYHIKYSGMQETVADQFLVYMVFEHDMNWNYVFTPLSQLNNTPPQSLDHYALSRYDSPTARSINLLCWGSGYFVFNDNPWQEFFDKVELNLHRICYEEYWALDDFWDDALFPYAKYHS